MEKAHNGVDASHDCMNQITLFLWNNTGIECVKKNAISILHDATCVTKVLIKLCKL